MRIALVSPANILYMPYVQNYKIILDNNHSRIKYEIINWDRLHIENSENTLTYRDKKISHQRNYFDYVKYKKFIIDKLSINQYDKIIVFGLQLGYFLRKFLYLNYKGKYILDIRDYNKIINFFNVEKLIKNSFCTVISSPGYKEWLPKKFNFVVNHNTNVNKIEDLKISPFKKNDVLKISYIGTLTNLKINLDLIKILKNNPKFELFFHGAGIINNELEQYLHRNNIFNVIVNGRYYKEEEELLYKKTNFVNMLLYNDNINNKTCLANRFYNSLIYGRPLIVLNGSYMAEQVKKYHLGLVLNSINTIEEDILHYIENYDGDKYNMGRNACFKEIYKDNLLFNNKINSFLN